MKGLVDIFRKMDKKAQIKIGIITVCILIFISGTVALIVSDQNRARKKEFARYQEQIMERLLQQQAQQQAGEYTEEDFKAAKKGLPPVEELDFDPNK
jgi:uncharacterized membrane protein